MSTQLQHQIGARKRTKGKESEENMAASSVAPAATTDMRASSKDDHRGKRYIDSDMSHIAKKQKVSDVFCDQINSKVCKILPRLLSPQSPDFFKPMCGSRTFSYTEDGCDYQCCITKSDIGGVHVVNFNFGVPKQRFARHMKISTVAISQVMKELWHVPDVSEEFDKNSNKDVPDNVSLLSKIANGDSVGVRICFIEALPCLTYRVLS